MAVRSRSLDPDTALLALPGIGPRRAQALALRGLVQIRDLLFKLPNRYQDWRTLTPLDHIRAGCEVTVAGQLHGLKDRPIRRNRRRLLVEGWLADGQGNRIHVVWFNLPPFALAGLPGGRTVLAHGNVTEGPDGAPQLVHPELYPADETAPTIRPIYSLPEQMPQRLFGRLMLHALEHAADALEGAVPAELRGRIDVPRMCDALKMLHRPGGEIPIDELQAATSRAHRALALDEMFVFQLALGIERRRAQRRRGIQMAAKASLTAEFLDMLPFEMTTSQRRAIAEIEKDMAEPRQMNRMLMGDVGSGKTVVALFAALRAVEAGYQAAVMAPTELLAEQHYQTLLKLCSRMSVPVVLLTGNVRGADRARAIAGLRNGSISLVFGTQALIQNEVRIARLGLAVIDEQHRFGVFDRARLKQLGPSADMLLMTATPIPRSLALILFSNLSISSLAELPADRAPITTLIFDEDQLQEVHDRVLSQVLAGNRAYYVLPQIDADETDTPSVLSFAEHLRQGPLRAARLGLLHGRVAAADKDRIMRQFRDGELQVLVSTTVVEVGIDVPEATVMVVMGAERYGLAQLHQLRGRVGRGRSASYCSLVASKTADPAARSRLEVLARTTSGADVARADLETRGPGDLLGARQSGPLPLRFADLIRDLKWIEQCRELADLWLERDPDLSSPASAGAAQALKRMLEFGFSLGDVG